MGPAVAASLSLLALGTLLWHAYRHDLREHASQFESDADSALQSLTLHLQGIEEYLNLIAAELGQGIAGPASFQAKVSRFLGEHPELDNVYWDDGAVVRRAVPEVGGKGPDAGSPEPPGGPSPSAQGSVPDRQSSLFEFRVPILREGIPAGYLGAVFSCDFFVRHTIPLQVQEKNRVTLLREDDVEACSDPVGGAPLDRRFAREARLSILGGDVTLRLERRHTGLFAFEVWLLVALCGALIMGMACGVFVLARFAEERQTAQVVLQRERDNLVNVFEAMEDGVAIVSPRHDVQYVNPALVKEFGLYEGRKCHEYFHGRAEACTWCMMEEVIAGKAVHSQWCYPQTDKTYDLIDSRVNNPDGTISKLKMFRDITARVQAESALRLSEIRFQQLFERAADPMFLWDKSGRIVETNRAACESLGYTRTEFEHLAFSEILAGGDPDLIDRVPRDVSQDQAATLLARHKRRDGGTFPVELRLSSLDYGGQRMILASARDITEREERERAIRSRLAAEQAAAELTRSRLSESESLHRVTSALLSKITLEEVLEVVCSEAQRLTGATGSAVLLMEDGHFLVTSWTGEPPPRGERLPLQGSFAGLAVGQGEPVFIPDLSRHDLACYREPRPDSIVVVPLKAEGRTIGVLEVAGRAGTFGTTDIRVLSHFADQAAVAIEKARLRKQAEQVAVMEERHRLARELHDSVTQALYSAALYADAASLAIGSGQNGLAAQHMDALRGLAREAMLEMRLLIFELHPPALEQEGLLGALKTRLATVETRAGLETEVSMEGEETRLSPQIEEVLYRFAQEALNNVIKHAQARTVSVRVRSQPPSVRLEVADDGVGFDTADACNRGMGLRSMKERLERIGGRIEVDSAPGKGTRLRAEVFV